MDQRKFSCSICLDLLKDPVTIPCGHNYCMNCIKCHWETENIYEICSNDAEDQKQTYSCPQCKQTFTPKPTLVKNTMLAELVEELKKTGPQAAPANRIREDLDASKKDKQVDPSKTFQGNMCSAHEETRKTGVQVGPANCIYEDLDASEKDKQVDPSEKFQGNMCSAHKEVMKIFCRTDQKCICYLCSIDEHKDHNLVSAEAERNERQKELKQRLRKNLQIFENREKDMKVLLQEVEAINHSADKAVRYSEKIFSELIHLLVKKSSDLKQQIRSKQETEVNRAKKLLEKLEEELTDLRRKDAELEKLSHTDDNNHFLHVFQVLSKLHESSESPCPKPQPLLYFDNVAAAVSEVKDKLQSVLSEECQKVSRSVTDVDVLLPQPEPRTRAEFLQYSNQLTLDPNTVSMRLVLTDDNRRATFVSKKQAYPSHPERFMKKSQVLSREALTGRHYWEVEWSKFGIYVAVAYKSISRTGEDSEFGKNDKSWALRCSSKDYEFTHDKNTFHVSGPQSSRIGVYLDHRAGILSFYSVSDTMTLLHRVQTTFTEPLYAGLRASQSLGSDSSAVFCELEQADFTL